MAAATRTSEQLGLDFDPVCEVSLASGGGGGGEGLSGTEED